MSEPTPPPPPPPPGDRSGSRRRPSSTKGDESRAEGRGGRPALPKWSPWVLLGIILLLIFGPP
ncbi:MAG: hypothetical protein ACO39Y_11280, partial [Ilumatobacteraceae bacterium]